MGDIIELTEDNLEQYNDLIGGEETENIGREYYRGIVMTDDKGKVIASAIWEMIHLDDDEKDTEARLVSMHAEDDDKAGRILEEFRNRIREEDAVSCFFELKPDESGITQKVFEKAGFDISETEGSEIVVTLKELNEKTFSRSGKTPPYIRELGSLMVRPFRRGVMDCIFHSRRELMEDLGTISMSWFEQQVSSYVETDDRVSGFLLIHKTPSDRLRLEVFTASGGDAKKDLFSMMVFSLRQALKYYPEDTEVVICRRDSDIKNLTDYLLPEVKGMKVIYGRKEGV
ncbi:MAG: hypothetical protein IKR23_09850 [Lachnospiraceae bacterium]|nr:hypothetical protein [Lachnospiraceae bacterium]